MPALRLIAMLLILAGLMLPATAQAPTFRHDGLTRDAARYETWLKSAVPAAAKAAIRSQRSEAEKLLAEAKDPRAAARAFAALVVADGSDWSAWHGHARALIAIPTNSLGGAERYEVPLNASTSAYLAYLRAARPADKAAALVTLADALKRRSFWRPAIDALKTSLELADNGEVRKAYEALKAEHGFRVVDYKIESDLSQPRLCIQLSERVGSRQGDVAKFIAVDGRDPAALTVEGQQLCLDGLVHGKRYEVLLRAGLPAESGDSLAKTAEIAVYVRDRAAAVRFSGRNYVLPSRGQQGLPVVTINTERIEVEVYRIGDRGLAAAVASGDLQRQLASYELEQIRERTGAKVWSGTLDVAAKLNAEVTTAVPVGDAIPELAPGVYAMIARPAQRSLRSEDGDELATQWFIVSDLGLTALTGEGSVHAFVRSLATAEPVAGAKVRLIARNNELLGEAVADADGYVRIAGRVAAGEGGMAPALLVAEGARGTDYAFLDLTTSALDLADRGVKGREAPGPLDAFLYADRGVFRPGETINLSAIVRDRQGRASGVPMTLIVTRPDGVEHRRIALADQGLGGRTHALALPGGAMTGTWRAHLHADPKADAIATQAFLVEDFVPERLDMTLAARSAGLRADAPAQIDVAGRYLYGPPAADLALEGEVVVRPARLELPGLAGYQFGPWDERIAPVRKPIEGIARTDKAGRALVDVALPPVPRTARPLEADVLIKLREPGGRTLERTISLPVDLRLARIGVRPLFKDATAAEGEEAGFEVIRFAPGGERIAATGLVWSLARLDQSWQWYKRDGQWRHEPVTLSRKIAAGEVAAAAAGEPQRISARVDWGRYRLEVLDPADAQSVTSVVFTAGWHAAETAESPEQLEVALDKPAYRPGDTAKLRISSRLAGKALVTLLGAGVERRQQVAINKGDTEVAIPVTGELGTGVYVAAIAYRPMDEQQRRMPGRAIGVRWLGIDQSARTLKVAVEAPEKVRSGAELALPIRIAGLAPGEEARVTVAAVDVGILNLTRFQSPDPAEWFHAQRRLGIEIRDLYGRLIDGMRAERGRLRSGGDGTSGMRLEGSPPVEATVAMFSGIVTVGSDGTARVAFPMPDFNGTVRLMAVAWSRDKVGHASRDVIVRDAVAVTLSAPRFLAYGDEAELAFDLHNVELDAATLKLAIEQRAGSAASTVVMRDVALGKGERKRERLAVKPAMLGVLAYDVRITGPAGLEIKRTLTFDVKPPAGDIRRVSVASLKAGGGRLALSKDLTADLVPGRTRLSLSVGPLAALDVPGLLATLDRYPYGCAEQTTSRALPLLYVNALASRLGMGEDKALKERVQQAIERVLGMQDSSGAFGIWGPRNGDLWLTGYVTDFLTRAKESGYAVPPRALAQSLDRLQNFVAYGQDFQKGGEAKAYALYVLARNGRAPIGELRYWADTRLERFATPLAKAHLGAALAMLGETERSARVFRSALGDLGDTEAGGWRPDYGSSLRDRAAVITLVAETRALRDGTATLARTLAAAFSKRTHTSTQEQAWLLLAANAVADETAAMRLDIGGRKHSGRLETAITEAELAAGLAIVNEGASDVDAVVSVVGAALTPEPAVARTLKLERSYYTLDGKKVDLESARGGQSRLGQSERLVAVLKVTAPEDGGRLLVVDRLPSGLEIENPRIVDGGDIRTLDWLRSALKPEHTEFRDDRFVAAFNFRPGKAGQAAGSDQPSENNEEEESQSAPAPAQPGAAAAASTATVAYIVRAVTPGQFTHPAATVEDMYRPERHARTAAGRLQVTAR